MKTFKRRLPLILLLSKVLIVSLAVAAHAQPAHAQEMKQDLHQGVSDCAKQLHYIPVQLLQLNHLKQEKNLSQEARFQSYLKILTPAQQQQLAQCTKAEVNHSILPH
ncbi:MAG: hypothetical protein JOZ78_26965 [Chroococcidiopsidaceae cyanobacterium CP_BM_ER_R8_30]|nr:hypothetical protein [Chroococcidiopsidaceae cyanobacterium CP_BM_ER_R8_30]